MAVRTKWFVCVFADAEAKNLIGKKRNDEGGNRTSEQGMTIDNNRNDNSNKWARKEWQIEPGMTESVPFAARLDLSTLG